MRVPQFEAALESAVARLPPVTEGELRRDGVLLELRDIPAKFRVSFGKTFRVDSETWLRPRSARECGDALLTREPGGTELGGALRLDREHASLRLGRLRMVAATPPAQVAAATP